MAILENYPELAESLGELVALLGASETIQKYQQVEQRVKQHEGLKIIEEKIKEAQKEAVQFAHYDKPEAEKAALRRADELTASFDEHPLVLEYRAALIEADDLLQHLVQLLKAGVREIQEKQNQNIEGEK